MPPAPAAADEAEPHLFVRAHTRAAEAAVSRNPLRSIAELLYAFAAARPSTQWRMTRSTQNRGKVFDRNPR